MGLFLGGSVFRITGLGFVLKGSVYSRCGFSGCLEAVLKKNECGLKNPQHRNKTVCGF